MKKTLAICFTILSLPFFSFSQIKETGATQEKSKIESFSLKTGNLIKKEFTGIGEVKKVKVQALTISDVLTNTKVFGIKLETTVSQSYGAVEKHCFLDEDEIQGLLKSATYLANLAAPGDDPYIKYQFTSRDGFQAGVYNSKKDGWSYFLKLEKFDGDSYVFLNKAEFEKLIQFIEGAKAKL